jgi:hypothetical protein
VDAHQVLAEDGREKGLLVLEVDVDQVLVTPGGLGDPIDARAGDAMSGKLRPRVSEAEIRALAERLLTLAA